MGLRGRGARPQLATRHDAPLKKRGKAASPPKDRVQAVIEFCQDLPVTKGIRGGAKMELLPDQKAFIAAVYGRPDRPVRIGIKSAPRGNGKTGLVAALALCHLLGPE